MAATAEVSKDAHKRIFDIVKGPNRLLMPIAGYEDLPLVTLEEAVIPLVDQLPRIQTYVHVAKSRCDPLSANELSVDQSASIMLYTMESEPQNQCLYVVLNATLRTEDRGKLKPWFSYLKLFLTALSNLPSSSRQVYRGVKKDLSSEYIKGEQFIWWAFSSCTLSVETLKNEQFLGKTGVRTLFSIECTSGKDISRHSYYAAEEELLLPPARQFQVVASLQLATDLHMIQLKEIDSPFINLPSLSQTTSCGKNYSIEIFRFRTKRRTLFQYRYLLPVK